MVLDIFCNFMDLQFHNISLESTTYNSTMSTTHDTDNKPSDDDETPLDQLSIQSGVAKDESSIGTTETQGKSSNMAHVTGFTILRCSCLTFVVQWQMSSNIYNHSTDHWICCTQATIIHWKRCKVPFYHFEVKSCCCSFLLLLFSIQLY